MKRMIDFSVAAAAMLVFPVVLCSCSGRSEAEKKAEPAVAKQEAKAEVPAAEVKAEPVLDNSQPVEKPAPAPVAEKKAEPAPAPAPVAEKKAQAPAPVAEKKAEPAPAPVAEKKAGSPLNPPVEHVVRTGDSLWKIAKKYYGSGAKWSLIYEANKSAIKKKDFLEPGTVLVIPAAK